jgi:orotate phosphoribosyltransferase-like protein
MKLSQADRWKIAKLRALGYRQDEIADELGVAQTTVAYQLRKLREEADKKGPDNVLAALAIGAGAIVAAALLSNYLKGQKKQKEVNGW